MTLDTVKFAKLMMMTTSSFDDEALVAVRKANALLAAENLNWEEFLNWTYERRKHASTGAPRVTDPRLINPLFSALNKVGRMGVGTREFIGDLYIYWQNNGCLTQRQYEALQKTYERYA